MKQSVSFETKALAKWFLNEPKSDLVEEYIQEHGPVGISDLTVVEMRSPGYRHLAGHILVYCLQNGFTT